MGCIVTYFGLDNCEACELDSTLAPVAGTVEGHVTPWLFRVASPDMSCYIPKKIGIDDCVSNLGL